eukprot:TRINITY_DN6587_c0_g1_i1.p1 TRINITY_DN6587_c0_g1~~TRINITY_DN6587_c0_g1_i1.p1  ORF type:complete len:485 (+),score=68.97 TRINITY_DN6587_c0_g1_i1:36-1490(+)
MTTDDESELNYEADVERKSSDETDDESIGLIMTTEDIDISGELQVEEEEPFPWKKLTVLAIALVTNSISITVLFPFVKFMVRDLGISEENSGYYVGLIASSFMLGRLFTAIPWGVFADRFGRKPALMTSLFCIAVLSPLFGMSPTVGWAVTTRLLSGASNSIIGIGKVMATEIAPPKHSSKAMSIVSVAWGLGTITGPAVGGLLSGWDIRYPYLPPMMVTSSFALVSILLVWKVLPETLSDDQKGKSNWKTPFRLAKDPYVMKAVLIYLAWSFEAIAAVELMNLWGETERKFGGLGISASEAGIIQSIAGIAILIAGVVLMPIIFDRFPLTEVSIFSLLAVIPVLICFPILRMIESKPLLLVSLSILATLQAVFTNIVFTSQFIFINNSVNASSRASAQGISMALSSLGKASGPFFIGAIFAWSISEDRGFPFNYPLSYYALVLCVIITLGLTLRLPRSMNSPLKDPEPEPEAEELKDLADNKQ